MVSIETLDSQLNADPMLIVDDHLRYYLNYRKNRIPVKDGGERSRIVFEQSTEAFKADMDDLVSTIDALQNLPSEHSSNIHLSKNLDLLKYRIKGYVRLFNQFQAVLLGAEIDTVSTFTVSNLEKMAKQRDELGISLLTLIRTTHGACQLHEERTEEQDETWNERRERKVTAMVKLRVLDGRFKEETMESDICPPRNRLLLRLNMEQVWELKEEDRYQSVPDQIREAHFESFDQAMGIIIQQGDKVPFDLSRHLIRLIADLQRLATQLKELGDPADNAAAHFTKSYLSKFEELLAIKLRDTSDDELDPEERLFIQSADWLEAYDHLLIPQPTGH